MGAIGQERKQGQAVAALTDLAVRARTDPDALAELTALDPQAGKVFADIAQSNDQALKQRVKENTERIVREATAIRGASPTQRKGLIANFLAEATARGAGEEERRALVDLAQMSPEDQEIALMSTLAKSEAGLKVLAPVAGDFAKTLVEAIDENGNRVFIQPKSIGGADVVPDVRPPGPTAKQIADTRKAEVGATEAEGKAVESARKRELALTTRDEISALATDVIANPNLDDAFGAVAGATPTLLQATLDVEADLDRLDSLLTLGNTDKMVGVLSESDIKILQQAGSILGNRRISVPKARAELARIEDVFARNPGAEQALSDDGSFTSSSGVTFKVK